MSNLKTQHIRVVGVCFKETQHAAHQIGQYLHKTAQILLVFTYQTYTYCVSMQQQIGLYLQNKIVGWLTSVRKRTLDSAPDWLYIFPIKQLAHSNSPHLPQNQPVHGIGPHRSTN